MSATALHDVFLSVPVQSRPDGTVAYDWLADAVAQANFRVLDLEVARAVAADLESAYHAAAIYARNHRLIDAAQVFVADVSVPSHGVGMELARANARGVPVICLWREGSRPLSKMILGMESACVQVLEYSNEASAVPLVQEALRALRDARAGTHATDALVRHFDELAPAYDGSADWRESETLLSWFRDRMPSQGVMIDAGSGTGLVAKCAPAGLGVVKVDLSHEMLRRGGASGHAVVGDLHGLPLRTGSADVVTMRQALHYVDEAACLRELHRVLKPGGRLLLGQITAPDDRSRRWWLELKRSVQPLRKTFHSDAQLADLVHSAGFEVAEHTAVDCPRSDPWERFVLHAGRHRHAFVEAFLAATPADLAGRMGLQAARSGVSYLQHWSLLSCTKKETA